MTKHKQADRAKGAITTTRNFDFLPDNLRHTAIQQTNEVLAALDTAPNSAGRTYLKKYYHGGRLTGRQTVLAKCCDCCGYYIDGLADCEVYWCSSYPFMPYGKMRKRYPSKAKPNGPSAADVVPGRDNHEPAERRTLTAPEPD